MGGGGVVGPASGMIHSHGWQIGKLMLTAGSELSCAEGQRPRFFSTRTSLWTAWAFSQHGGWVSRASSLVGGVGDILEDWD